MKLSQNGSDKLWDYYQNKGCEVFDLSYPRLRFLAKQCDPGTAVLNIGAGSGYLENILQKRGVVVYSLDPNLRTVARLNDHLGLAGRAKQGYCHKIPFPSSYFDCVIMTEVIEHIEEDLLEKSITEVRRVLKNGGAFIGTVPFNEILRDNYVFCPHCHEGFHRWGHLNSFDESTLITLLKRDGFSTEKIQVRTFPDFSRSGLGFFIRAVARYILGKMRQKLVNPNLYFVVRRVE